MSGIWDKFGFEDTPYKTTPLEPNELDNMLFTGRIEQAADFITQIDRNEGSVVIISGDPGIGKTSFFNIQQFRVANELATLSFKLMPAYKLTSLKVGDDERSLAKSLMHNALESIAVYCQKSNKKMPPKNREN